MGAPHRHPVKRCQGGGGCVCCWHTQPKGRLSRSYVNSILRLGWVTSRWEGFGLR